MTFFLRISTSDDLVGFGELSLLPSREGSWYDGVAKLSLCRDHGDPSPPRLRGRSLMVCVGSCSFLAFQLALGTLDRLAGLMWGLHRLEVLKAMGQGAVPSAQPRVFGGLVQSLRGGNCLSPDGAPEEAVLERFRPTRATLQCSVCSVMAMATRPWDRRSVVTGSPPVFFKEPPFAVPPTALHMMNSDIPEIVVQEILA